MTDTTPDASFFKMIFESSVEGILVIDDKGNIKMANSASNHIFGYKDGELLEKNMEALIPQKFVTGYFIHPENNKKCSNKSGGSKDMDLWGIRRDGTQFPIDYSLTHNSFNGNPVTVVFLRDTAKRLKRHSLLEKSNVVLAETNRKYSTLIGNLQGIVFRCQNNRDFTMEYISEGCTVITGRKPQEFLKEEVRYGQIILSEDRDKMWDEIQKAIAENRPFDITYRIHDSGGGIKYLRETGSAVFDLNGNVEALEGFITDITDLKYTEEELRGNLAKNKALLEALPDLMFINDFDGNCLDLYTSSPEKLQIQREEVIGKNMKDILSADVHSTFKKVFKNSRETKTLQLFEFKFDGNNGPKMYEGRSVLLNQHGFLTILRDITERKAVEKNLFIRNKALESAGNGITIVDVRLPDSPIIYANKAYCNITGYSYDELIGRNSRFLQNDDRDQGAISVMSKAVQKGEPCQVELRNYKKDGTLFWNEINITPIHNEKGELTHFIGVQNDITERKREEQLNDSAKKILEQIANEELLPIIANSIIEIVEEYWKGCMVSILLLDKEQGTLHKLAAHRLLEDFNKEIEGYGIDENLGCINTAAFLKQEVFVDDITTDPRWADYRKLALKHEIKSCWSFPIFSSKREVLGTFSMYWDHKGKPQTEKMEKDVVADITYLASVAIERHRINEELEQSKKQLEKYSQNLEEKVRERTDELKATVQKLVETNLTLEDQILETRIAEGRALESQAMFTAISKNFPNGIIVVFNTRFEIEYMDGGEMQYYGFKKNQFKGKLIDDISVLTRKYKERIKKNIKKTMKGAQLTFEAPFKDKTYSVSTSPLLGDNGEVKWSLFVYNDITKLKDAEENITRALVKEQELNELKSRFISMASHEFRTPLSAISTSAILIAKQNMPGKEERREKYVEQIHSNVRSLVDVLNDFLSLSKLEEGKVKARLEKFDLVEFTQNLIHKMEPNRKRGQKVKLITQEDSISVYLDPRLLQHVVSNLLSNAIKYSEIDDLITVKLKNGEEKNSIEVTDQGIGIPADEQANLFQRFFRAENSTNIQGTGLGLHIVKQYTELLGGKVSFKSEVGKGTTFLVEFEK